MRVRSANGQLAIENGFRHGTITVGSKGYPIGIGCTRFTIRVGKRTDTVVQTAAGQEFVTRLTILSAEHEPSTIGVMVFVLVVDGPLERCRVIPLVLRNRQVRGIHETLHHSGNSVRLEVLLHRSFLGFSLVV